MESNQCTVRWWSVQRLFFGEYSCSNQQWFGAGMFLFTRFKSIAISIFGANAFCILIRQKIHICVPLFGTNMSSLPLIILCTYWKRIWSTAEVKVPKCSVFRSTLTALRSHLMGYWSFVDCPMEVLLEFVWLIWAADRYLPRMLFDIFFAMALTNIF